MSRKDRRVSLRYRGKLAESKEGSRDYLFYATAIARFLNDLRVRRVPLGKPDPSQIHLNLAIVGEVGQAPATAGNSFTTMAS